MPSAPQFIFLLKALAAVIMAVLAVFACWLLAGRKLPHVVKPSTLWWVIVPMIWAAGGVAVVERFTGGLGAMTNLTDTFPWGIWIGFDVLSGVALAAGGFLTAGSVYIFGKKQFYPILRPAILTAYLGYLLVVGGLMMDLGRPYNIWHPMIYWQHRSVMFEVGWCVTLYTVVLTLEFLPILLEKLGWERALQLVHKFTVPIVIAGIILSTLHQSSLGALFLIVPEKLLALWYTPLLPVLFLLSAAVVGLAMLILESTLSARCFRRSLETPIITTLARALPWVALVWLALRVVDLTVRNAWALAFQFPFQGITLVGELALIGLPVFVLLNPHWVESPSVAFRSSVSVVGGVVLHRLNVAWFGMIPAAGTFYVPSWQELSITLGLVSAGVIVFGLVARYLPLFQYEEHAVQHGPTSLAGLSRSAESCAGGSDGLG